MPTKYAILLALDACVAAGPLPLEPAVDMHKRCNAWAIEDAQHIDRMARQGVWYTQGDYLTDKRGD